VPLGSKSLVVDDHGKKKEKRTLKRKARGGVIRQLFFVWREKGGEKKKRVFSTGSGRREGENISGKEGKGKRVSSSCSMLDSLGRGEGKKRSQHPSDSRGETNCREGRK